MKDVDFLSISIICSLIAATLTAIFTNADFEFFINEIGFQAIIVILCMNIITMLATESNILEYIAIKLFKISKGKRRLFFYLICLITTLLAAIISDVVVAIILAPVIIRLCRFLKIDAGTFLLGMVICINIGSILTPFSSGKNIIISTTFGLDTLYFVQHYWIYSFFILIITLVLIDRLYLKKEPRIEPQQKKYVLELIDSDVVIKNRRIFYINIVIILATIAFFVIIPELYLVAAFSAFILIIINRKFTEKSSGELLRDLEWEVIFFFIALYIIVACLKAAGFRELLLLLPFDVLPTPIMAITLLLIVAFINAFVANNPTALFLIPFIDVLIIDYGFATVPIFFAFIIAINLGGNFLPTGCTCNIMILKISKDQKVKNMNYKRLLKVGGLFTLFHIGIATVYLLLISPWF
jgi:Na+/H+ antiporter NhaD/arsenite permease-like protein